MSQFRSILFALVIAGCGSDDGTSSIVVEHKPLAEKKIEQVAPKAGFGEAPVVKVEDKKVTPSPEELLQIPEKLTDIMKLGKQLADTGEHKRARILFEAAAKKDRTLADPHVELARSYISTSEKGLAIKHASKAVKLAPESSHAYNTLGRAELLRHDYDAAIIAFRQATELNADNVWAWNNLGLVYLTLKDYPEAINALSEATNRKGAEGYMWNNLGLAYEQLDQLDEARDAFEAGSKLGSVAAKASRKRLDGVDTVVVAKKPAVEKAPETYEDREEMPEVPPDIEGGDDVEPVMEDSVDEAAPEPAVEEKVEEPTVEEKAEAPKPPVTG
jgi:tetratricopeptide (TPR) repeat protein